MPTTGSEFVLNPSTMNPYIQNIEYAVRGPIVAKALEIQRELDSGLSKKPYKELIWCNIGDCHAMGQKPISFLRQVLALITQPSLLESDDYPSDAKHRARRILDACHGLECYSPVLGLPIIREDCASYIQARDGGVPSNPDDIILSTGAGELIKELLQVFARMQPFNNCVDGDKPGLHYGVMIPIPQYPLYTATIAQYNLQAVPYYLDESDNWSLDLTGLHRAYNQAEGSCIPRVLVVINPGNPTGQVLRKEVIEDVVRFAKEKDLFVLADEVYQHNVYVEDAKFYSFKQVMHSMGAEYLSSVQLASLMSASKGYAGECGFRGGYCELLNPDAQLKRLLHRQLSNRICPSVPGQAILDVIVNPPKPDEPSFAQHELEKSRVLGDLALKARMATETFNSIAGMRCNPVQGAMYAFPSIELPQKLIDEAKAKGMQPDVMYCTALLEEKGVCVVAGSGFGQRPGTFHFRMTILPPLEKLKTVMELFREFHQSYVQRYV